MALSWHCANNSGTQGDDVLPFVDFFKTAKGVGIALVVLIVLVLLIFRSCNKIVSETENETIEVIDIDVPVPGDYDANCLRITGKPCPTRSK